MKTLDVLRSARKFLSNEDRWCKNVLVDPCGRRCLMGAMSNYVPDEWSSGLYDAVCVVETHVPSAYSGMGLAVFNDAESTTHANVLDLLDRAIAAEEAGGDG